MADLKEIQKKIDIQIAELRQQAHFAINKYDYHHKNDELQIIEYYIDILNQVAGTCVRFLNEMQKFNKTLTDAKELSAHFEKLLIQSQPTTQHLNYKQHESPPQTGKQDKLKDNTSKKQLFLLA